MLILYRAITSLSSVFAVFLKINKSSKFCLFLSTFFGLPISDLLLSKNGFPVCSTNTGSEHRRKNADVAPPFTCFEKIQIGNIYFRSKMHVNFFAYLKTAVSHLIFLHEIFLYRYATAANKSVNYSFYHLRKINLYSPTSRWRS